MDSKENDDKDYLLQIGFRQLANFRKKKNRENYLVWYKLYQDGSYIRINLIKEKNCWRVEKVDKSGTIGENMYNKYLSTNEISEVISFVKNNPMSTNP